jgi:hypothetical protein
MSVPPHQYPNNRRDPRDSAYVSRMLYAHAVFLQLALILQIMELRTKSCY